MGDIIYLHYQDGYDHSLRPIQADREKAWWDDNSKTRDHAKHCLPLIMANSLGYFILSPGTFIVRWNGNIQEHAVIEKIDGCSHYMVDDHAAFGSFTVQAGFIPRTIDPGDYVYVKGIANERSLPYTCMEAAIEAWWNPGVFGLVYLLNQPGEFLIRKGQPIAQMFLLSGRHAASTIVHDGVHPGYAEWIKKRSRPGYRKDLDYMVGKLPDGSKVEEHVTNWKSWNRTKP